ncbi:MULTISPECIES: flagellar protein FlaG [unclassified Campylobacter]|uniref:flagellar protein FlaG n=1 Tax=unclassified Campylobacter TaxID=2593542 RepID=UPI001237A0C4|nr:MULTISPECIES: flagellar protein FlaG [unclassified Campylobacter]KAA6225374.1 flagellar biosynthesis protein FlaG [Campylobacter sp. LR185c]KAA6227070.1 flagellar biosynthesis protein FlaG [Campylobacter sp. LR196d]KAA6227641.1 flagellar biosynthesis protein FlaG [Campylobacter sp. LR286c]KAA6229506.1 flagellar biosynthesis protein FlaG [Campylobacter sp. LR264d]KAA8604935.1 flagellar biosynthesis protein FlaG [Campylobacter sp. LR185c]
MEVTKLAMQGVQMDTTSAVSKTDFESSNSQSASTTNTTQSVQSQDGIESTQQSDKGLSEKLAEITQELNEQMETMDSNIRFGYSDEIDRMYVSVVEKMTGKEIRRIPTEEAMRLTEYFRDAMGMIYDEEV